MKTKHLLSFLAAFILLILWGCEQDPLLTEPSDDALELRAKGGEKGKPDKPGDDDPVPDITITDLGTLGGSISVANGINVVNGDIWVVGRADGPPGSGFWQAFLWKTSTETMENIGQNIPGADMSVAHAVDNDGTIVGNYSVDNVGSFAVKWNPDGTFDELGPLNTSCPGHGAKAINQYGVIVGYAVPSPDDCNSHMWTWNSPHDDLGTDGELYAGLTGINSNGAVVGWAGSNNGVWWPGDLPGFGLPGSKALWSHTGSPDDLTTLPVLPQYEDSHAADINDAGQIVGTYMWDDTRAFIWTPPNDVIEELPTLGGRTFAYAISEEGYVTGNSLQKDKKPYIPHAFLYRDDIGMVDLGPQGIRKDQYNSAGFDVMADPNDPTVIFVVGKALSANWDYTHAVLWTIDLTPLL